MFALVHLLFTFTILQMEYYSRHLLPSRGEQLRLGPLTPITGWLALIAELSPFAKVM